MNIFLWILQVLLALHTVIGALWKISNLEQIVPSLKVIPQPAWQILIVIELLCSVGLIIPVFNKRLALLIPIAAAAIAAEMLLFCGLHIYSGDSDYGPIIYWLVVAVVCAFVAYGRLSLKPLTAH